MSTPRWEDRWPGRYEYELNQLRAAGIFFEVDEALLESRILRLTFKQNVSGKMVVGEAVFPDLYPDFRPAVQADQLGLTHHQNPLGGNLCLLGRGGDRWRPSYTLAWLLTNQLRLVIASGEPGAVRGAIELEDVQAEPFSAYVPYEPDSAILVDGDWVIPPNVDWGRLVIGTRDSGTVQGALRAAVLVVTDGQGNALVTADPAIANTYRHQWHGRWGRSLIKKPDDLNDVMKEGLDHVPMTARRSWPVIPSTDGALQVFGALIPEEIAHRQTGQGWIFGISIQRNLAKKNKGAKTRPNRQGYFARPVYSGRHDLQVRIPELRPLSDKSIAIFGVGSLGAPAALELARAGIGVLRMLDGDHVEAGPSVRWPLGLKAVGRKKVDVLDEFIRENYPYTKVTPIAHFLGEPAALGKKSDQRILDEILNGVDLVFDATANLNVQRMLAELARERNTPYVMVEGRHGGWGGVIFRQDGAEHGPCLYCLQRALQPGGKIGDAPAADAGDVQPRGCGDVTFTGTAFDMATIALDAVRRVAGTLSSGSYPNPPGNVAVISLRNEDGSAVAPLWTTYELGPDRECGCGGTIG